MERVNRDLKWVIVRGILCFVFCLLGSTSGKTQTKLGNYSVSSQAKIDTPIRDFALRDMVSRNKVRTHLSDFRGKKPIVLVFMANRCGLTWTYEKQIAALTTDYAGRAQVLIVHSNYEESDAELLKHLKASGIVAPTLDDKPKQSLAHYLNVVCTPTFAVVDTQGVLRYKGAFEESNNPAKPYLRPALDAVLAHRAVVLKSTRAIGCDIASRPSPKR